MEDKTKRKKVKSKRIPEQAALPAPPPVRVVKVDLVDGSTVTVPYKIGDTLEDILERGKIFTTRTDVFYLANVGYIDRDRVVKPTDEVSIQENLARPVPESPYDLEDVRHLLRRHVREGETLGETLQRLLKR